MEKIIEMARIHLAALVVFRSINKDHVVLAFREMLDFVDAPMHKRIDLYSTFVYKLLSTGQNWSEYLINRILCDENSYVLSIAEKRQISQNLQNMMEWELELLERIGQVSCEQIVAAIGSPIPLAGWETSVLDYTTLYSERMKHINEFGYGIFAEYQMFLLKGDELVPVRNPDTIDFQQLTGYERERKMIIANTLALVEGKPAANALLYGDSGTGKSTCVKAVTNKFKNRGLRLIELHKDQLDLIPALIDKLNRNPLKFILFIDDLSFAQYSDNFSSLKGILEGSISAKTSNTVIYATSNLRHLIREKFSEREGDDVHVRDTMEEMASLSGRFGLTITFQRPDVDLYMAIVKRYIRQYDLSIDESDLKKRAEAFALGRGGRSARTAKQFVEQIASQSYIK